jgi:hypothetical protein
MTADTAFYLVAPGQGTAQPTDDCLMRRGTRQLELEDEILKSAAAYFARENIPEVIV